MTGQQQQIVTAFEELGLSPEEIAEQQEIEELSVKATLLQFSGKFRTECKEDGASIVNHNFADNDLVEANATIAYIMRNGEDEHVRFRAAKYIRDDKKGRLDALKNLSKLNINVAIFNEQLLKAREAKEKSKSPGGPPLLEAELIG